MSAPYAPNRSSRLVLSIGRIRHRQAMNFPTDFVKSRSTEAVVSWNAQAPKRGARWNALTAPRIERVERLWDERTAPRIQKAGRDGVAKRYLQRGRTCPTRGIRLGGQMWKLSAIGLAVAVVLWVVLEGVVRGSR